ncbi:MAG: hypothetical protein EHM35_14855 [Planctomycetaceae bacterium]|nr:MAG: hypothetical protein EHM35_14855 [Planctomycetaceae bacterium]
MNLAMKFLCEAAGAILLMHLAFVPSPVVASDSKWISMAGLPGANGSVRAAVVDSAGTLYIGGDFTIVGNTLANYVARWDGTNWSALGSGMNTNVAALAILGNDLYAGGWFTNAGGVAANYIARWDGTNWVESGCWCRR